MSKYSPGTYDHSLRVADLAVSFGKYLKLNRKQIETLRFASLLHDIGKLEIPDEILHKRGLLTKDEYNIIKNHSKYGYDLIMSTGFSDHEVLKLILCHHERLDGLGYPNGLKDKDLDLLTKILTICDCFDAMKCRRVYKETRDLNFIKNEFLNNMGTQFDTECSNLFLYYLNLKTRKK